MVSLVKNGRVGAFFFRERRKLFCLHGVRISISVRSPATSEPAASVRARQGAALSERSEAGQLAAWEDRGSRGAEREVSALPASAAARLKSDEGAFSYRAAKIAAACEPSENGVQSYSAWAEPKLNFHRANQNPATRGKWQGGLG